MHGTKEAINRQLRRTIIDDNRDLHNAALVGNRDDVQKLLNCGADTEIKARIGMRPLHIAAEKNNVGALLALLGGGAKVDSKDDAGATPLHIAASRGHQQAVTLLLSKGGADMEAVNNKMQTPLHLAVVASSLGVVKELMDRGVNKDARDFDGWTPVYYAAVTDNRQEILELLQG